MNESFVTNYPKDKYFSTEELLQLTPEHIYAYLAKKAYGKVDPTDTDNQTHGKSSSLKFHKKTINQPIRPLINRK